MATAIDPSALHHIFYASGGKAVEDMWASLWLCVVHLLSLTLLMHYKMKVDNGDNLSVII